MFMKRDQPDRELWRVAKATLVHVGPHQVNTLHELSDAHDALKVSAVMM
jgi:hypothetical protein